MNQRSKLLGHFLILMSFIFAVVFIEPAYGIDVPESAWTVGWGGVGNDYAVVAQPLEDGSIITTSRDDSLDLVQKFDSNGSLLWSHSLQDITPSGVFAAESSTLLPDGRALFFGSRELNGSNSDLNAELIAVSTDGVSTAVAQFGGPGSEFVKSVGMCPDGSFFVGGTVWSGSVDPGNSVSIGMVDLFVARFDSSFNRIWIKQFGSTNNDALFSVSCRANNSAVISAWGAASINGQGSDDYYNFYVIKYGAAGNLISTINGEQDQGFWSPQRGVATPDGSMYVVGEHNSGEIPSVCPGGSYISKYNSSGDLVWREIIDCRNLNRSLAVDAWGNLYVMGGADNIGVAGQQKFGGTDILLHKYTPDGERLWTRQFGSSDDEFGTSIAIDNEGNVIIGALSKGLFDGYQPINEYDGLLIKNRVGETGVKAGGPSDVSSFISLAEPKRVVDTRGGGRFGSTSLSNVSVKRVKIAGATTTTGGATGLPSSGIGAVALNVTAVNGFDDGGYGFVTVYPCDSLSTAVPDASNLNFAGGQTIPNAVIAPVSADGYVCFSVYGNTDLLVDASGYFS